MYIALSATKKCGPLNLNRTMVLVFSNEATSLKAMSELTEQGNMCHRFVTDADAFTRYSNGENLEVNYVYNEESKAYRPVIK